MSKKKKLICGIDYIKGAEIGGPTTNSNRILNSELSGRIKFVPIFHDMQLGKGLSLKRILDLKRQILDINADVILISGVQLAAFHILIACILAGQRSRFMILRGFSVDALDISVFKKLIMGLLIEPLCFIMCTKFVGNSFYTSSRLISKIFFWKNKGSIYNLIPETFAKKNMQLKEIKTSLGVPENKIILSSVGRITTDKGYKLLAESILSLSKKRNDFVLLIAGDGTFLNALKFFIKRNKLENYIFLLGIRKDVENINGISDIFIMPSLHETLSSALLEAGLQECALIASNNGGMVEIVKNGFNGLTFKTGSQEELENSISFLLDSKKLRVSMGKNAKNFILKKFDNKKSLSKLESFLCN